MQSHSLSSGASMTSGIAIHEGHAGQLAEVDAKLSHTRDRPVSHRPAAIPKKTLRERLRRPLLVLFPIILAAIGAAYFIWRRSLTS